MRFRRTWPQRLSNVIGMRFARIPAGTFWMGSPPSEEGYSADEGPRHEVHISRPFYLGVYPVTQHEYELVMGHNPSRFGPLSGGSAEHPVEGVSWEDADTFCRKLSALRPERRAHRRYRLSTEAEWEYACRAGTTTAFAFGDALGSDQANFNGNHPHGGAPLGPYLRRTNRVGSYAANAFGLYDLHGNVWEWCSGYYYDEEHYRKRPRTEDEENGKGADHRVIRGGSCMSKGVHCRCAERFVLPPGNKAACVGFRVLCSRFGASGEA
jgi:formylglycine-generating enzyme required for sulfatase activity